VCVCVCVCVTRVLRLLCHHERTALEKGQINIHDVSIYIYIYVSIHNAFIVALLTLFCMAGVATTRKSKVSSLYAHEADRERRLEGYSEGRGLIT